MVRLSLVVSSSPPATFADFATQDALPGEIGEFLIRGPNLMQGYVLHVSPSTPSLTSAFTPDGFFKTGDIGYIDYQGYCFLVDRAKEMIKVKGYVPKPVVRAYIRTDAPSEIKWRPQSSKPYFCRIPSSQMRQFVAYSPKTLPQKCPLHISRRHLSSPPLIKWLQIHIC